MTLHSTDGVVLRQWQLTQPAHCLALLKEPNQQSILLVAQHGGQVLRVDTADSAPPITLLRHAEDAECVLSQSMATTRENDVPMIERTIEILSCAAKLS